MISAAHRANNGPASARDVPRKTDAWLPIQAPYLSETAGNSGIGCQCQAIERIAGFRSKGADERRIGEELPGSWIPRASAGGWTGRGWSELHGAAILVEDWGFRRIETCGIEIGCSIVPLMPWQVIAHAKTIIQRQATIYFPLILRVPLNKLDLQVHERARAAFTVASEIADEGGGVGIGRVSESGCEVTIRAAKVECPRPVSAGGFSISDVLKIYAGLITVATQVDRKIIGERRQEIIMAGFAPPIEP